MRARVEFDVVGDSVIEHWDEDRRELAAKLLKRAGFAPVLDPDNKIRNEIWSVVPEPAASHEEACFVGYDDSSQLTFVASVSANPSKAFVRLRSGDFGSLQKATTTICKKLYAQRRKRFGRKSDQTHVDLDPVIRIFEDESDKPFMIGRFLKTRVLWQTASTYWGDLAVGGVTLALFLSLFFAGPVVAGPIASWLGTWLPQGTNAAREMYIESTLERIGSACFIAAMLATLQFLVRYREIRKYRPIAWAGQVDTL